MATPDWKEVKRYDAITYHKCDGVARIAFNRPEVRNAFRPDTLLEMIEAFRDAGEDTDVGVVLPTGNGPAKDGKYSFCSGGDPKVRRRRPGRTPGVGGERDAALLHDRAGAGREERLRRKAEAGLPQVSLAAMVGAGVGARGGLAVAAALLVAACARGSALEAPTPQFLAAQAPDSFVVEVVTSEGPFELALYRAWSPLAVDRAYLLFANDYYAGARIYRVAEGFVAQWGFSGRPALDSVWRAFRLPDEPVVESNLRGVVSFARAGPESRSYTLFVNLTDNVRLDTARVSGIVGYPPIGRIVKGLDVIDGFYGAYKEPAPRQDSIGSVGNDYLRRSFPQLDSIVGTRVIRVWP